jgi:hypothetical protein
MALANSDLPVQFIVNALKARDEAVGGKFYESKFDEDLVETRT